MARVKIDLDRKIGKIEKTLFGSFIEQVARSIYGGIYDPSSIHADEDGFRKDVIEAIKNLNVSVLRWPGGHFADTYRWKDGIGRQESRPVRPNLVPHWPGHSPQRNIIGTDEYVRYCRKVGAEPYIVVNCSTGDATEAAEWVEYCNGQENTFWANERRKNGNENPHAVRYWGLGNEIGIESQVGYLPPAEYALKARDYAKLMRAVSPDIRIAACGSHIWDRDWGIAWDFEVVRQLYRYVDLLAIHTYVNNDDDDFKKYMGFSNVINRRIENTAAAIQSAIAQTHGADDPVIQRAVTIAMDEWCVYSCSKSNPSTNYEQSYTFEDALVMAMYLNSYINHCSAVTLANGSELVNCIAPIRTKGDKLLLQSIYYPMAMYAAANSGEALDIFCESDDYETSHKMLGKFRTAYLDMSCSHQGETIVLNVVNKSASETIVLDVEVSGMAVREAKGLRLTADGPKAENTFENPGEIRRESVAAIAFANGRQTALKIPPLSLTIFTIA